jgi:hypothetical protein
MLGVRRLGTKSVGLRRIDMASVDGQHIDTVLFHALQRLWDAQRADPRCACIATALYFVEDYNEPGGGKAINAIRFLRDLDRQRLNPFASYYLGWFDYSYSGSVKLDDEPEFIDRVYRAELAIFRTKIFPFQPTGYDLVLCDVCASPAGDRFRFSTAVHLSLSELSRSGLPIEELLLETMQRPGEYSCIGDTWAVEGGLLASEGSVVGPFARYLEGKGLNSAFGLVPC